MDSLIRRCSTREQDLLDFRRRPYPVNMPASFDASVYLVTDSTEPILKGRDLLSVVDQALQGGKRPLVSKKPRSSLDNYLWLTTCSLIQV